MSFTRKISIFILAMPLMLALSGGASAQDGENKNPLPRAVVESEDNVACRKTGDFVFDKMLAERCVKQQRKEFEELMQNGEEAAKLSSELDKSYEKNPNLLGDDQKKLDRLEKLFKKIRGSLGADGDGDKADDDEARPSNIRAALNALSEKTSGLLSELKKTSRYSISVIAIQSSNALIRLVKFVRFSKN
jgi:hypothetical protein